MTASRFDIVMLALARWDGQYSSTAFSLAKELSRYTRVFYIDNPFTYKDFLLSSNREQIEKRKEALLRGKNSFSKPDKDFPNLVVVTPRLVYPVNWLPPGKVYKILSRVNDLLVYRVIEKLLNEYEVKRFVFINSFNPLYGNSFPPSFSPALRIYHCVDDIRNSEYVSKHGSYLEEEAVRKADVTLVTSMELKRLKSRQAGHVYYLPNAADVRLFNEATHSGGPRPAELMRIPPDKRIILYMGNICQRVDYELLVKLARIETYYLVMVGPQTHDLYRNAGMDKMNNVVFTGRKDLKELPSYLRFADCCIIPFLCIPLTQSIYPLKINEYLAAGKPVVTTDFSEDIINFGDVALVSKTHNEFIDNVAKAIESNSPDKQLQRMGYVAANNWRARADELLKLIDLKIR